MPTEGYAVGPIRSGESAQQTFIAPGSYLSGIDVAVRPHKDTRDPLELQFRLSQVNDGQVVREGRVTVQPDPANLRQTISWRFQIIPESAGRRYAIAVIPAEDANGHVFLPISLEDPLDGTLATNGQLAGEEQDLLLAFVRRADGGDVLRALRHSNPLVVVALALMPLLAVRLVPLAFRLVPVVFLSTHPMNQRSKLLQKHPKRYLLIIVLWAFATSVAINRFSAFRQPEANPWFWIVMVTAVLLPGIVLAALYIGSIESRRASSRARKLDRRIRAFDERHGQSSESHAFFQIINRLDHGSAKANAHLQTTVSQLSLPVSRIAQSLGTSVRNKMSIGCHLILLPISRVTKHIDAAIFHNRPFGLLSGTRTWWLALAALLILAIAVRALAFMAHEYAPWLQLGSGTDADTHLRLVLRVLTDPSQLGAALYTKNDTALLVPISATLSALFGIYRGLLLFTWLQILLVSSACIALTLTIARLTRSRVAGISAGLLLALHPLAIQYSIEFMSDGMGIFFFILTLWLFFEALTRDSLRLNLAFGFSAALLLADRNTGWVAPLVVWIILFIALKLRPFATRGQGPPPVYVLRSLTPLLSLVGTLSLVEFGAQLTGAPFYLQTGTDAAPAVIYPAFGLDHTHHSLFDLVGAAFGVLDILTILSLLSLASRIPYVELLSITVLGATFLIGWVSHPGVHVRVYQGLGSFSEKHLRIHIRLTRALIPAGTLYIVWQLGIHIISSDRWINMFQDIPIARADQQAHLDAWFWNGAVFTAALLTLVFVSPLFRLVALVIAAYAAQAVLAYSTIFHGHPRVDLPLIIVFYVGVGIAIGLCSQHFAHSIRTSTSYHAGVTRITRRLLGLAHGSLLTWLYLATLIGLFVAGREVAIKHLDDRSYFEHLGSVVAEDSIILTTGHLDPWMVQDHVDRLVVFDGSFAMAKLLVSDHEVRHAYQCARAGNPVHLSLDAADCLRESANVPPDTAIVLASPSLSTAEAQTFLRSSSLRYLREATLLPIPELLSRYGQEAWVIVPAKES